MNFKKIIKKEKGFTLIEMLVSMTLFSFVVTIALGALFSILKANEKTKVIKLVVNNLSIALEGMSREIRVGYDYRCTSDECSKFEFTTKDGCDAYYRLESTEVGGEVIEGKILKKIKKKKAGDGVGTCTGGDSAEISITGGDIIMEDLKFRTKGLGTSDDIQSRVLINLKGSVKRSILDNKEEFNIQTTVSQRKIDK